MCVDVICSSIRDEICCAECSVSALQEFFCEFYSMFTNKISPELFARLQNRSGRLLVVVLHI